MSDQHQNLTPEQLRTILWKRGVRLLDNGKPREALNYLLHLEKMEGAGPECLNKIGVAYAGIEDLDRAEAYFSRALELDPGYAQALSNTGNILYSRKQYEQAIDLYKRALAADPTYYLARRNMAAALRKAGRVSEAVQTLRTADRHHSQAMTKHPAPNPPGADDNDGERQPSRRPLGCLLLPVVAVLGILALVVFGR